MSQANDAGFKFNDCIELIYRDKILEDKKITYASFVCDQRPLKAEEWHIRLVVGGDKLSYNEDSGSPATDLTETKLLLNSVISDSKKGARFLSMDLKDMFLKTIMDTPEYMKIPIRYFPPDIIQRYNLTAKVHNNYIFCKIKKGMYGLKQAAVLAHKVLAKILLEEGYEK